ncbi:hypothetical protein WMY93_027056 [Mugilogobius chulae]|uniref:TNFR-Cys domain-containing protein n=1 Tax=Mugilogobius chulae TaxID=88201 RepID=A0AAW0MWI9_9GOBI
MNFLTALHLRLTAVHLRLIIFLILLKEVTHGCHRAEYLIGQECCPMCPVGTRVNKHCTEFRSTSCLPCDSGTYMDEPTGKTECLLCRRCDKGSGLREKTKCTPLSNTVCEPEEGHFCLVYEEDDRNCGASKKHKNCQPGEYINQPGSSSADTQCSPCAEGTFSNGTVCQRHTQCQNGKVTVKDGTATSTAARACCQPKEYATKDGQCCPMCLEGKTPPTPRYYRHTDIHPV